MQVIFIFLIITSIVGSVRMQNWLGIYTIDSMCNTTNCCCPIGQMSLTNYSENTINISSNLQGQCGEDTILSELITYPDSYISSFVLQEITIDMALASNSRSIVFVDTTNPACNFNAVKNNISMKQKVDIMVLFPLILVSFIMNIG